jgi:hypothetical protein
VGKGEALWLSYTGTSWNVQNEADLGKPSGYLFVADTAALPSRAKATWRGADGKRGWEDLPALRCRDANAFELQAAEGDMPARDESQTRAPACGVREGRSR